MSVLQKNEVLAILRYHKRLFSEQYGVTDLGVFGSVARDEAHPDSDVDIVVHMRELNCSSWFTSRTLSKRYSRGPWTSFSTARR